MIETEPKEELERQAQERVDALRKILAPLTLELKSGDEPALVFRPDIYPQAS